MALRKSQRSLKKWTSQKWDYVSKGDKKKPRSKRGRYLPASVRKSMTAYKRHMKIEKNEQLVEKVNKELNTLGLQEERCEVNNGNSILYR